MEKIYYESKPSPKVIVIWLFSKLLMYLLAILLILFVFSFDLPIFSKYLLGFTTKILFIIVFVIILALLYLNFLFQTYNYKITDKGVYFKGGIIVKEEKFAPFFKITDVRTSQNIIEQLLSIKKLGFQTAGQTASRYGYTKPEIEFEGLEDAEKPRQLVYQLIEKSRKSSKFDE